MFHTGASGVLFPEARQYTLLLRPLFLSPYQLKWENIHAILPIFYRNCTLKMPLSNPFLTNIAKNTDFY